MSSRDGAAWQDYAFDADILTQNGVAGLVFRVTPFQTVTNRNGGKAYFAARPTVGTLPAILDDALPAPDVAFEPRLRVSIGNGVFSYLHKHKDGHESYCFANSRADASHTFVRLRGGLAPQVWDPRTGEKSPAEATHLNDHGQPVTHRHLKLAPVSSVFMIAPWPNREAMPAP